MKYLKLSNLLQFANYNNYNTCTTLKVQLLVPLFIMAFLPSCLSLILPPSKNRTS